MNVNSLLPHNAQANQNTVSLQLEKKWERTGLLEGLSNEVERKGMAVLLENQARQLVSEASATGTGGSAEEWSGVALPLVRRIFAEIAAKDFVSVQPMNLPSGLVFYLDFKYGSKGNTGNNSEFGNDFIEGSGRTSQLDSVFGVTDKGMGNGTDTAVEGLYGVGRFGYSINDVTSSKLVSEATDATAVVATTKFQTGSITEADFNYNSAFSASITDSSLFHTISVRASDLTSADLEGVRGFNLINTTNDFVVDVYPEFTKVTTQGSTNDTVQFLVKSADDLIAADAITVVYHKAPTATDRGDFEDVAGNKVPNQYSPSSTQLDIPEINLEMRSEAIVAKTRKLKAVWSPEFAQDLNAYHSIDAEAELTSMLSEYVSQEIDLEILDMLINNAQTTAYWSARIGYKYDTATALFVNDATAGQAYNQGTWFQTLGTQIQKVSNKIHQLTLRGGANFLVCSPSVATILESIPGYAADTDGDKQQFAMGVQKVGAINNRFQVYKNPYMTENAILMGYRGSQFLETGAVYSPYIPLIMTPLVYDPDNFTPRKGVMTRYAKKVVRPEFYGKVLVHALDRI
jgi:hypothetical protein